ncbi:hypothetical protein [Turicimonas muris]|uniref:hypothetical protein n=2 Tax=Turicimonas muris TaxID=1796652 RepID=UPI00248CADB9|nr:hypothetical protein [Turicimonas muris]
MMTYHFKLYGVETVSTTIRGEPLFNKKALERFCHNNNFKYPFEEDTPQPNTVVTKSSAELETDNLSNVALAPDQLEVVDDITVGDIRKIFDKGNARYRAPLELAIRTWLTFEIDPKPEGVTTKNEIKARARDINEEYGLSVTSNRELEDRIATLINWDKDGNKFK